MSRNTRCLEFGGLGAFVPDLRLTSVLETDKAMLLVVADKEVHVTRAVVLPT